MKLKYVKIRKIIVALLMIAVSCIVLVPFFILVTTSLKTPAEVFSPHFVWLPERPVFENYLSVFKAGRWDFYFKNSATITIGNVFISLFFNSIAGFAFARLVFKGRNTLFIISMIAMMIPAQVTMLPLFIILKNFPLVGGNNIFGQGGTGFIDSFLGVMLPGLAGSYGVFLCRQYFISFPQALDDASEIDGCNKWQMYFKIYLPLAKPILATLGTLKLTASWNDYVWPLIILQSKDKWTVQLALALFKGEATTQWNLIMAATVLTIIPVLTVFLAGQRFFIRSLLISGLKG